MHERDLRANRFHVEEVKELRDRILAMDRQTNEKDKYYETVEQTVENINSTIPKLINDKIEL